MGYKILFNTIENGLARRTYELLTAGGHEVHTIADPTNEEQIKTAVEQMGESLDILVLSMPSHCENGEAGKTIKDILAYDALLDTLSGNISGVLQTAQAFIPLLRNSAPKRIVLLTDQDASIRETQQETDYAYHMSQAGSNMIMKILFNTYRPEGFTFRCYADGDCPGGMSAAEYLLTEQSYIETDDYIHSDENRLVMRDAYLREISW